MVKPNGKVGTAASTDGGASSAGTDTGNSSKGGDTESTDEKDYDEIQYVFRIFYAESVGEGLSLDLSNVRISEIGLLQLQNIRVCVCVCM